MNLLIQKMERLVIILILGIGWPVLGLMTFLIIRRGANFHRKLKEISVGKLIIPTIFGWLFGMYALGIVCTAYILGLKWYWTVIPAFLTFLAAIIIVYRAMRGWEKEAVELRAFYKNLESLVKKRTKELEKAHRAELAHEKEIQKLKDQFVFIAAHELKTPVTAIRWGIEAALDEGKKTLDPELIDYLKGVQESNRRLINLVDDLLNVARIEAGTIKVEPEEVDLDKVINQTLREMRSVFVEKDIVVSFDSIKNGMRVRVDRDRFKQVMINLLSNATKYNHRGGSIEVKINKTGSKARVSVSDSGIGIKKKDMNKLFKKFSRIEDDQVREEEGTGLGLFLSQEIVEKMGGKIKAESVYGEGSTFSFTVPLV